MTLAAELREAIDACAAQKGACVLELLIRGGSANRVYEIFIDNEEGVSLGFCSEISRDIKTLLDRLTPERQYRLIVSSPGFDRPLKYPWQFKKHVGKLMQVTERVADGMLATTGRLASASADGFVLLDEKVNGERRFAYDATIEARLKAPW